MNQGDPTVQRELSENIKTESEIGMSHSKIYRWQLMALLPEKEREKYYEKEKKRAEGDGELTESGLYRYTDRYFRKPPEFPPMPKDRYRVIYADPPWQYSDELVEEYGKPNIINE